jgi:DNA-binding transcriptional LysR family regulator
MPSLRALECLVALIEVGSVTQAATSLHMSQPALSHQIASLEREVGTALVVRLTRGIRPTAAGLAVANEGRIALTAASDAIRVGRTVAEGKGGRIRIVCAETMTAWLLVPLLRQWRRQRPDVELDLSEHTSADRMIGVLEAGGADIAVCPRPSSTRAHLEVLGSEEMVVVSSLEHRFGRFDSVAPSDLEGEPFVHYKEDNGNAVWVDQFVARHEVTLQTVLRTRSPRTAAQLAAAGMGVTIAPYSALTPRPGGIVRSLNPVVLRDVVVVTSSPQDALVRLFAGDLHRRGLPKATLAAP